ncbi:response regulator [Breoghania sp. L-A4]|uniref:response regulator n=1 Tax=Breoghania sp. L-A4 TaxID=2304600 RepID=UPI000E35D5DB|nr:response regulator [Breoghania sp. L-A4]AXS39851.1 response regulator [Breoghania sp. L-A4]
MPQLRKIVYADDEPDIREVVSIILSAIGNYDVVSYASGAEALEKAAHESPDLILLDVMMPGLTGPETLAELRLRPETMNIPAIFITAKAQAHEIAWLMDTGAVGVVTKPFDPATLTQRIEEIWAAHSRQLLA